MIATARLEFDERISAIYDARASVAKDDDLKQYVTRMQAGKRKLRPHD